METKSSVLKTNWLKIPLIIRAILIGTFIALFGISIWGGFATYIPLPWSVVAMAIFLYIYWKYFSGYWKPKSTQEFRKSNFRNTRLSTYEWKWGIITALLMVILLQSGLVFTFRLIEYPEAAFKQEYQFIEQIPVWMAWIVIVMASCVAGICEEIGFRGYMQAPLEKKYGPFISISIVSIIFLVVHLHQAWAGPIILQIIIVSAFIGYLAYSFDSLIPGIIAHVVFDIFNFSYWWSDLLGKFTLQPISATGIDAHFVITTTILVTTAFVFIIINKNVRKHRLSIN